MENWEIQENIVESEEGNEGWVETHHYDSSKSTTREKISKLSSGVSLITIKKLIIIIIYIFKSLLQIKLTFFPLT